MKEIPLTQGYVALVDDEDYDFLSQWKWHYFSAGRGYAARSRRADEGPPGQVLMHRAITNAPPDKDVDHWNGNGLDNRRENLRVADTVRNVQNSRPRTGTTSRFKGVHWRGDRQCWRASIQSEGKVIGIGHFDDEVAAARAYDRKAIELFGEFAWTNFPREEYADAFV